MSVALYLSSSPRNQIQAYNRRKGAEGKKKKRKEKKQRGGKQARQGLRSPRNGRIWINVAQHLVAVPLRNPLLQHLYRSVVRPKPWQLVHGSDGHPDACDVTLCRGQRSNVSDARQTASAVDHPVEKLSGAVVFDAVLLEMD